MDSPAKASDNTSHNWTALQKTLFRFFFLLLSALSLFGYNIVLVIFDVSGDKSNKFFGYFGKPLAWSDHYLFNIGYNPSEHAPFYGDGHFGWAMSSVLLIIAVIGSIIWAIADRKSANYNKLHYWFRSYLAYYLFFGMIMYAIEKIIPIQMSYPNITTQLIPLGDMSGFNLVWNFIGSRPSYEIFTGICELTGSLLVLSRRTRVFGSLFLATVLTKVVCFNVFYNIPVKLLCSTLLLADLFLMAPYIPKLYSFFYRLQPVSLAERKYAFAAPWKNYLLIALLLIPALVTLRVTAKTWGRYKTQLVNKKKQKLYDVTLFISGKDTLPPLLTDTFRWKRFAITNYRAQRMGVIFNMKDVGDYYSPKIDSSKEVITLTGYPDTSHKFVFDYRELPMNKLSLKGKIKGENIKMLFTPVDTDPLLLNKEKIKWLQAF